MRWRARKLQRAPDLTDPINVIWTDPNNNRFFGNINTEQGAVLTFSGKNGRWNYMATVNYSQNGNSQQSAGGNPDEWVLAPPAGILSDLINPFGPLSAAGQNLVNSSYLNGTYVNGKLKRWSASANASHELGDALHAGNPAVLALGVDAEGESYDQATTALAVPLQAATAFVPITVHGSRQVQAVFAELDVPMSTHLDVDISDREDRYSDFGSTNNGKVSLRYQPFQYLTFRASASAGFRAPSLINLFFPNNIGPTGRSIGLGSPFCTPGHYNTVFTPALCQSQGLGLYGGNRNLKPETSQNFNFGFVVEPVSDLGITVDYYRVLLKNAINTIPGTAIYGDPTTFANNYVLNQAGTLTPSIALGTDCLPFTDPTCGYIVQTPQNTGGVTTHGIDLSVQYTQHTPLGVFRQDLEGTAITRYRLQQFTGGPALNLVGWYNRGNQPALRWQHILRFDWTSPDSRWGAGLANRLLSSYVDQFPDGEGNPRTVGTQSIWDAYTSFKPIESLTVLFGVRNLLNTSPPFSNTTVNCTAGYNSVFSDPILRAFYLNLKYRFL